MGSVGFPRLLFKKKKKKDLKIEIPFKQMRNHLQQLQRHPVELMRNHTEDRGLGSLSVL